MTKRQNNFFKRMEAARLEGASTEPVDRAPSAVDVPSRPVPAPVERQGGGFMGRMVREQNTSMMAELEQARRERDEALERLRVLMNGTDADNLMSVDPDRVAPSPYARRLPIAYTDSAFQALVDDIKREGGNHTPVLVRKYTGPEVDRFDWEVIAGHRRRAGCAVAQTEVLVLKREATNQQVVRLMASENGKREPESPLELGLHFKQLLDDGTASSERHLAELTDTPRSTVKRYLKMTEIDSDIIGAFSDPREIRVEWVQPLLDSWAAEPDGVRARLAGLRSVDANPSSLAVFKAATDADKSAPVKPQTLRVGDKVIAKITSSAAGKTSVQFTRYAPQELIDQVLATARSWHKKATGDDEGSPT